MKQKALRKAMWEDAGKAGLALGLISTAYLFLTQFLTGAQLPAVVSMLLNTVLWAAKFGGCIWLMMIYMKRFSAKNPELGNAVIYRYGMMMALLSALVYAAASFANTAFISADMINEQFSVVMQQLKPAMDSNSINQMTEIMDKLPQLTFFSNLFYCAIYGSTLSFILSRNIPSRDPFANHNTDEQ